MQKEARNVARAVVQVVRCIRAGMLMLLERATEAAAAEASVARSTLLAQ